MLFFSSCKPEKVNPPSISAVSPSSGAIAGGTLLTISGADLKSGTSVIVGSKLCSVVSSSSDTITCTTAANVSGTYNVSVTNANKQTSTLASAFTYVAPAILTSVSPSSGLSTGATTLTIIGSGFTSGATVKIGSTTCASPIVFSSTLMTCVTAATSAGVYSLSITNGDGQITSLSNAYIFRAAPTVTAVTRNAGSTLGGTTVTVTGTGFYSGASVLFDVSACTSVNVLSSTSLTCVTPTHAVGAVTVQVTNADSQNGSLASAYTYQLAPTYTSVSPSVIGLAGGTILTITGANFYSGASVKIGGTSCSSLSVLSSTSITCTAPAHIAGNYDLVIMNADTQSVTATSAMTYQAAPTVTSVTSNGGPLAGTTSVTITGTGFLTGATVKFDSLSCTSAVVVSSTSIICSTPSHAAGTVNVVVTNTDAQLGTLTNGFTYRAAPTVTSVSQNAGAITGSTFVTITGTGFVTGATVTMGSVTCSAPTVTSSTTITCYSGAHAAGLVTVAVTNTDSQSGSADVFTYQNAPSISSVSPSSDIVAGGTTVTITGNYFLSGATVAIGGVSCTSPIIVSATTITCQAPAKAAGLYTISVTNTDSQTGSLLNGFTYHAAPTITSLSKSAGSTLGGTAISIFGTGFFTGATVTIGGVSCGTLTVVSPTTITCTTSAHATGLVSVVVTNTDTQTGTFTNSYTYQAAPTVTSLTPTAGAAIGGTVVTITGTGFLSGATVKIGGNTCTNLTVFSSTSITCTTAAHASGAANVVVTNTDLQTGTLTNGYTFELAPSITSVSINAGPIAGGSLITVTGANFISGATVAIDGVSCTGVSFVSATSLTCTTPAHSVGVVNVVVTNPDSQIGTLTNGYTYQLAPTVTRVTPNAGALGGGTFVTVTGTGFVSGATITFDGVACSTPTRVSSTSMTCMTPLHVAGLVTVDVANSDGQSGSTGGAYTYQDAPVISTIAPIGGPLAGGATITITGTGFLSGATVTVGGSSCSSVNVLSSTSLTCVTPSHALGAANVVITNPDTQTGLATGGYTYQLAPTVSSISPANAPATIGTLVTINGVGFLSGATVTIGGTACTGVSVVSLTQLTCTTPIHSAGLASVVVTNFDNQSGTDSNSFTFNAGPTVTSITHNAGPAAGGTSITIHGTNFSSGATVLIDATACSSVVVVSSLSITCVTPAHALGAVDVTVINSDSQTSILTSGFTYQVAPTVGSVSQTFGPLAGLNSITITGSDFVSGATVTIGGGVCTLPIVTSASTITCTVPSHAAALVNVVVTNSDGQSGTLTNGYSFVVAPTVTSITPSSSPLAGGATITITGTGFLTGVTAKIGGTTCSSPILGSSTTMTCTIPVGTAGIVSVVATNADGQYGTLASSFTYHAAPTISSFSPPGGNTSGGTLLTITGTGFYNGASVSIGGSACTGATVVSATSITCTTPAHAAGTASVTVVNADSQSGTTGSLFTYAAAPTITFLTPNAGAVSGLNSVTINGTGFQSGAIAKFDGVACTLTAFVSSTQLTCTTPAGSLGLATITVTNPDSQVGTLAGGYMYLGAPTISSISSNSGPIAGGRAVTISGTNYISGATVSIGGVACSGLTVVDASTITCTTGNHVTAGIVDVVVTNTDGQTGTLSSGYNYRAAPTITSFTPSGGSISGGTSVTITGTGFYSGVSVAIGGASCATTAVSTTSITCLTSALGASTVSLVVTNTDAQTVTAGSAYTYQPAPTVTSISATSGSTVGGLTINVYGTGFIAGQTILIDASSCTSVVHVSSNHLTCHTPAHSAGVVSVSVQNPDTQTGSLGSAFTYIAPPVITSLSKTVGSINGGTVVVITGTGFDSGTSLFFDGNITPYTAFVSSTQMRVETPSGMAGTVSVQAINSDGQSVTMSSAYTYQSMAELQWNEEVAGTYSYGSTNTNITHTFILLNIGDQTSGALSSGSFTITGVNPAAYFFGTNTCAGLALPGNSSLSCTVQITFLGQFLDPMSIYSGILSVSDGIRTESVNMSGVTP